MKKSVYKFFTVAAIFTAAVQGRAATTAEMISPFLNETTVAVIRIDLDKMDIAETEKAFIDSIQANTEIPENNKKQSLEELKRSFVTAEAWLAAMKKSGGREIYIVVDILQLRWGGPIMIVPKTEGADVKVISSLLHSGKADGPTGIVDPAAAPSTQPMRIAGNQQSAEIKGMIVHASKTWIDQISKATPADRPNLAKAFESAGNGMISGAVVPTDTIRGMLEQNLPVLPPQLGGGPITDLSRGIDWISIGMESIAKQETLIIAQAASPDAAAKVEEIANTSIDLMLSNQQLLASLPQLGKFFGGLRPVVDGSKLTVTLKPDSAIASMILPRMAMAQQQAVAVKSMSNMRQLLMAMMIYSNDNKGVFPVELTDLKKYLGNDPASFDLIMTNPQAPDRKPGYIFLKPVVDKISQIRMPQNHLILYESFDKWPGRINAGFADGHVELIVDKTRFEKLVTDAGGKIPEEKKP